MKKFDLEDRTIEFSISIIELTKSLENSEIGKYFTNQIARSSASSSLNYAEAKGSESRRDFIHKLKVSLKELHETHASLRIIAGSGLSKEKEFINECISECGQLIAMLTQSIKTAKKNMQKEHL